MTDRHSAPQRSPSNIKHTLQWQNGAGESIPAFGVIRLTAYNNTTGQYTAEKHNGTASLTFVNGASPVANGAYGGSMDWSASRLALVASGVTLGQEVGPVDDSYIMSSAGTGFVVFSNRDATSGTAAVIRSSELSWMDFYLGESLAAATNPRTGWTTARGYLYYHDTDGDLVYSGQSIIRNRYTGVEGEAGQYGVVFLKNGKWWAETLDCDVDADWTAPESLSITAEPGPGDA